ncbi:FimV/HubP family polar landmark protein, partial [Vibrio lentus]|uniref:FimV/HubP family polar landmark protein n=1 Tax=Vibrio lentus TaxID=136468 RepID=UPI002411519D
EPEPEPVRAAHMPEIIPNEFGVPEDDDWLIEDDTAQQETLAQTDEVTEEPVVPAVESLLDAEPQLDSEPQVEAAPQTEVAEQVEEVEQEGEEEFSFDDFELPEFNEEDALAEADAEVTPEPLVPAAESLLDAEPQLDVDPKVEAAPQADVAEQAEVLGQKDEDEFSFDDFELPEFNEEDAFADADVQAPLESVMTSVDSPDSLEPEVDALAPEEVSPLAPEASAVASELKAEEPTVESEEFSFDDFELPEFGEDDALAEVVSEPDEAQLEQDLSDGTEKFEFDDLDLPEYDEESAKADSVLDDIEQSNTEPVAEDQGVELDVLDLPEYGEDEAISDAFAEKPTPLTSFSPQGEEQDALHDLFSNPQSFSHSDDFSDADDLSETEVFAGAEEPELAAFGQSDELPSSASEFNSGPAQSNSAPTAVQDEPLEGFDDFDETALAELLSEDVQDSVDNMFDKPLDATSIDSAGLDIDAMLEVGGEDWKGFNLAPEQQSSLHNDVPDDQQEIWASAEQQPEPKIKQENWAQQDNLTESGNSRDKQYMTIDELMAQVEQEGEDAINPDDEELKLDVGLNEFPDVIGDIGNYDVDSNAEAAGKLDLAKIYIEMSDSQGAIKLLEEAIVDGSDDIRREAKNLIDTINGR